MIQMRLWTHDCGHQYVTMKRVDDQLKMVCVGCGTDVEPKSALAAIVKASKERRTCERSNV